MLNVQIDKMVFISNPLNGTEIQVFQNGVFQTCFKGLTEKDCQKWWNKKHYGVFGYDKNGGVKQLHLNK